MEKKTIQIGKATIVYKIYGQGKPVFLLHGFGEAGFVWNEPVRFLQSSYQLIVPDLPGCGDSQEIEQQSMESLAAILHRIADAEKITSFILIGHSMGGYIGLAFAELFPQYLSGFGLFHSTAYPDSEEKKATRKKGIEFIRQNGAFNFLKTTVPSLFSPDTSQNNPLLIEDFIQKLKPFSSQTLITYYEAMMARPDRTAILRNSKFPILFIIGEYDNATPKNDMLAQAHIPENTYIHIFRSSGHMGILEEPVKANEALNYFINNCYAD